MRQKKAPVSLDEQAFTAPLGQMYQAAHALRRTGRAVAHVAPERQRFAVDALLSVVGICCQLLEKAKADGIPVDPPEPAKPDPRHGLTVIDGGKGARNRAAHTA